MKEDPLVKVLIGTRVSKETQMALKLLAAQNDRSLSEEVRLILEKRLEKFHAEIKAAG